MIPAPEFSSLIVSCPRPRARSLSRLRGLALAATLYSLGLIALILAPFLALGVMHPLRAGINPNDPPIRIEIRQPGRRGDNRPVGNIQEGIRTGRRDAHPRSAPKLAPARATPRVADLPAPPPGLESVMSGGPADGDSGSDAPYGDPMGNGSDSAGTAGGCSGCPGAGPGDPGDSDGPYDEGTPGLIPPSLVPGTRALPGYPDLARRAGLQGTVVLLVVIEADGAVGEIEVVKSPDQRWGFDLAAINAVKRWRYQPALMNGRPVAASIQVMVEYTLAR